MDKATAIKLLAGTLTRGILWVAAAVATKYGVETLDENTVHGLAGFGAAIIVAAVSVWWSKRKDQKLLDAPPPD
ncbi:MAG TPA: hypothetical protein VMY35_10500 [Phycisphaerae bacterium]|nr:hypothetical protein [Phycisphaerae bacterium]